MNRLLLSFLTIFAFCLMLVPNSYGQQIINSSIQFDDLERTYLLYVPPSYTGDESVPLVLNFHGYTSNSGEQFFYSDFRAVADLNNFLVVHPQGTQDSEGNTHWNVGWGGSTVDDVGFTAALIDSLAAEYNINPERIYSTGMSNGGFMSYQLACELSDRIAAIASVTGTMNLGQPAACNATRPIPVMEVHGTADDVVPYEGAGIFLGSEPVIDFWVEFNNCNASPTVTDLPDINTTDGSTVEWRQYGDCDSGVGVELYKIFEGGHTWPGSPINFAGTNYDMNATEEIWRFFSQYDINGEIMVTDTDEVPTASVIKLFPNPTADWLRVSVSEVFSGNYHIQNTLGQIVRTGQVSASTFDIQVSDLPNGIYVLAIDGGAYEFVKY
ncbi:MAG: PHB depolymerase family esterase [Bacteroidota bacterium]